MRPGYSTITPATVHAFARSVLTQTLRFPDYKQSVSRTQLLDLLLLVATTTRTLFAIATRYFDFSHETARQALHANLPTRDVLTAALVDALHAVAAFSRRDRRRRWTVAIDTHAVPYYGRRTTPHLIGGQKKQGPSFFPVYATAVLLHRRRRYTVGLLSVEKGWKPHEQVKMLLDQVRSRGLTIGGVVLDAGFDSGDTLLLLQKQRVSDTVPLRRKGTGTNRRNAAFDGSSGTRRTVRWVTETSRRRVSTRVLIWQRKGEPRPRVDAFGGWGRATAGSEARRAWRARRRYRERFGIETSYRQKNQGRGWTTSARAEYRLLLEGLALVLRQIWVGLTQQIAHARGLAPTAWVGELPLVELLLWLAEALRTLYPSTRRIDLDTPTLAKTTIP